MTKKETGEDQIKKIGRYYLFYGTNDFMIKQKISSLIKTVVQPGGEMFDLDRFDGKRCEPADLINSASTAPVMSPLRVTVLENADKLPAKSQALLLDFLPRIPEYSVLAMTALKADKRSKLFKQLLSEKKKASYEYKDFSHADAVGLVVKMAGDRGKRLESQLADAIVGIFGTDPYRLENEIEKLALLSREREEIEKKDLAFASGFTRVETAYDLPEMVIDGRIGEALELCDRALASGISEMQILYIFKNHFDRLNCACNLQEFKELMSIYRIPYIPASRIFAQSKRIRPAAILNCLSFLFRAEYALKSARYPSALIMELLVVAVYLAAGGNKERE